MKKTFFLLIYFSAILICFTCDVNAQVGINSSNDDPDPSAMLDVVSDDKGVLIPRVALQSVTDASTINTPANSLLVYNTGTGGLVPAGYYYNSGTSGSPNWTR